MLYDAEVNTLFQNSYQASLVKRRRFDPRNIGYHHNRSSLSTISGSHNISRAIREVVELEVIYLLLSSILTECILVYTLKGIFKTSLTYTVSSWEYRSIRHAFYWIRLKFLQSFVTLVQERLLMFFLLRSNKSIYNIILQVHNQNRFFWKNYISVQWLYLILIFCHVILFDRCKNSNIHCMV